MRETMIPRFDSREESDSDLEYEKDLDASYVQGLREAYHFIQEEAKSLHESRHYGLADHTQRVAERLRETKLPDWRPEDKTASP